MFDLFSGLDFWIAVSLFFALAFVLAFEFINGFHDTANAVATVIYTNAMPPRTAVALSGVFNFAGVLFGGVGVAYAIVHLLPVDLLINVSTSHGMAMVFSLLAAAILWNFGTVVRGCRHHGSQSQRAARRHHPQYRHCLGIDLAGDGPLVCRPVLGSQPGVWLTPLGAARLGGLFA
jgi:hypothetical protein